MLLVSPPEGKSGDAYATLSSPAARSAGKGIQTPQGPGSPSPPPLRGSGRG
jgi:hypothetical protein